MELPFSSKITVFVNSSMSNEALDEAIAFADKTSAKLRYFDSV